MRSLGLSTGSLGQSTAVYGSLGQYAGSLRQARSVYGRLRRESTGNV